MSFYRTLLAAIEETTETAGAEILSHCRREEVVESRRLVVLIAQARTIADLQSRQEKNEQMLQEIYDVVIKLQGAGAPAERKKSPKLYDNVDN